MSRILFLTSSPFTEPGGPFNHRNGFLDRLKKAVERNRNALFITASPDDAEETKKFAEAVGEVSIERRSGNASRSAAKTEAVEAD